MYGSDEAEFVPPLLNGTYAMEKHILNHMLPVICASTIDITKDLRKKAVTDGANK